MAHIDIIIYIHKGVQSLNNKHRRLPLNALRTFESAARLQSFKQAAAELSVTPATVSNQIRKLERDWACPLFIRKTRQLELTDAGISLARVVQRAFNDISAEIDLQVRRETRTLTLAAGPIFASRWLIPRLNRFRRRHPHIELVVHHGPRISGANNMPTDVAIDWGTGNWRELEFTPLMRIQYAPVVSPILANKLGGIAKPADLARFPILHQHDRSEWIAWLQLAQVPSLKLAGETVIADANVAIQAAIDGQGVALGTFPFLQGELNSGRLLRPFDISLEPTRSYYLLTRPGDRDNAEIKALCAWLESEAGTSSRVLAEIR